MDFSLSPKNSCDPTRIKITHKIKAKISIAQKNRTITYYTTKVTHLRFLLDKIPFLGCCKRKFITFATNKKTTDYDSNG
jgi:hypothetical protein